MLKKYDRGFLKSTMMGPNSILLLREMVKKLELNQNMRILDLGCGMGLTSIDLAFLTNAKIYAMDLWISATDNFKRIKDFHLEEFVTPIHSDITVDKTFADDFFDALISIDSYHYYGRDKDFLDEKIAPLVKKDGIIALVLPGLKEDFTSKIPDEILLSWSAEDMETIRSIKWWKELISASKTVEILEISEMETLEKAWDEWLESDNPYAVNDRKAVNAGALKYFNFILVILKKK